MKEYRRYIDYKGNINDGISEIRITEVSYQGKSNIQDIITEVIYKGNMDEVISKI